jgi:hypothetical protein
MTGIILRRFCSPCLKVDDNREFPGILRYGNDITDILASPKIDRFFVTIDSLIHSDRIDACLAAGTSLLEATYDPACFWVEEGRL